MPIGRDSEVEIVIRARDEASRVLQELKNKLVIFDEYGRSASVISTETDKATRAVVAFDAGVVRSARSVRELIVPLASGLEPALRSTSRELTGVLSAATHFAGGLAGISIAVVGVAGVVGGQLLEAWRKNREELQHFNREIASMDMGRITTEAEKARRALEPLRADMELTRRVFEAMKRREEEALSGPGGGLFGREGTGASRTSAGRSLQQQIVGKEAEYLQSIELLALGRGDAESGQRSAWVNTNARSLRGSYDFLLNDPIEQKYRAALNRADDFESAGFGTPYADQQHAAGLRRLAKAERDEAYRLKRIEIQAAGGLDYSNYEQGALELYRYAIPGNATAAMRDVDDQLREIQRREGIDVPLTAGMEGFDQHETPEFRRVDRAGADAGAIEDRLRFERERVGFAVERNRLERQWLDIAAQAPGLTERQRDALEDQIALERERLRLLELQAQIDIEMDPRRGQVLQLQQRTAQRDEEMKRAQRAYDRELRDNPMFGLSEGFREIEEDWAAAGRRMQDVARGTAQNMQRAFSDLFFNAVTGDFDRISDVAKDFGRSMLRTLTDELAKAATAPIAGAFGSAARSLYGGTPFSGSGGGDLLSLFGGGGAVPAGYQVLGSTQINGQNALIVGPSGSAGGFGGGGLSVNVPGGGYLMNAAQYGTGALVGGFGGSQASAYGQAYWRALSSGASVSAAEQAGIAAAFSSSPDVGLVAGGAAGAGALYGSEAAAAAAAGASPYGASVAATGASAGSGAVGFISGYGAGNNLSTYAAVAMAAYDITRHATADSEVYSDSEKAYLAVHDIANAAANLYTYGIFGLVASNLFPSAYDHGFIRPHIPRKVREALSVRDVLFPQGNAMVAEIAGVTSPLQLWNTLVRWGSGYTGGTTSLAIMTSVNGRLIGIDYGNLPNVAYATLDELLDAPETFRANAQYGVSQHFKDTVNRAVEDTVRAKIAEFDALYAAAPVGYTERVFAGAVERATVEPFSPSALRGRGLALSTLPREQLLEIFEDDDMVESFLRRAYHVNGERQLGLLANDGFPA